MQPKIEQAIFAATQEKASTFGGVIGWTTFLTVIFSVLKSYVDEKHERDAVVAGVLSAFDTFAAPRLGPMAPVMRMAIPTVVDGLLQQIAGG